MASITHSVFRFHGVLNAFLPRHRRHRAFAIRNANPDAPVKHTIEALGVPHTEVALVRIDDRPVGLEQPLTERAQVTVYPWLAVNPDTGTPLRPATPRPIRFVADAHLGRLAHYLRMFGFDTAYAPDWADRHLATVAANQGRVLLTRDRALLMRRAVVHGCFVHTLPPERQIREVLQRYQPEEAAPLSLCLHCNRTTHALDPARARTRVPPSVARCQREFRQCPGCGRLYWKGSHYHAMRRFMAAVEAEVEPGWDTPAKG